MSPQAFERFAFKPLLWWHQQQNILKKHRINIFRREKPKRIMKLFNFYNKSVYIQYRNQLCSTTTVVVCALTLAAFAVPYYLLSSIRQGELWDQQRTVYEQPKMSFQYSYLFLAEMEDSEEGRATSASVVTCSSFPSYNTLTEQLHPCSDVQVIPTDTNHDHTLDHLSVSISFNPPDRASRLSFYTFYFFLEATVSVRSWNDFFNHLLNILYVFFLTPRRSFAFSHHLDNISASPELFGFHWSYAVKGDWFLFLVFLIHFFFHTPQTTTTNARPIFHKYLPRQWEFLMQTNRLTPGQGAIVNISSGSELQPLPYMTVYAATKVTVELLPLGHRNVIA